MERFVFGTKEDFLWLENLCQDFKPHYWFDVSLPPGYGNDTVDLSFFQYPEKSYKLSIKYLTDEKQVLFHSLKEMMEFFWSLQPLYDSEKTRIRIIVKLIQDECSPYKLTVIHVDEEILMYFLASESKNGARVMETRIRDVIRRGLLNDGWTSEREEADVSITGTCQEDIHFNFITKFENTGGCV